MSKGCWSKCRHPRMQSASLCVLLAWAVVVVVFLFTCVTAWLTLDSLYFYHQTEKLVQMDEAILYITSVFNRSCSPQSNIKSLYEWIDTCHEEHFVDNVVHRLSTLEARSLRASVEAMKRTDSHRYYLNDHLVDYIYWVLMHQHWLLPVAILMMGLTLTAICWFVCAYQSQRRWQEVWELKIRDEAKAEQREYNRQVSVFSTPPQQQDVLEEIKEVEAEDFIDEPPPLPHRPMLRRQNPATTVKTYLNAKIQ
jgi:hypothetical protein